MTTVAEVIADGLLRSGTPRTFAVADGDTEPLIQAFERSGLSVVRVPRADLACAMAAISGRLAGAPGAALIGRDLTGAAPGLASAARDRAPAVVIGTGGAAADEAVVKASLTVTAGSAAHWIAHACQLAMTEPWGAVHLGVTPAVAGAAALPLATSCRPAPPLPPSGETLDAAVRVLEASERPVVVVGRLCRSEDVAAWVRPFAEARPAPVLATPSGRGVMPDPHPLTIGILDGGDAERTLVADADLIVAVGVDPVELRAGATPVLHLTPVAADSLAPGHHAVVGDIALILEELAPRLRERRLAEWDVARLHALKTAAAMPPAERRARAAWRAVDTARRLTPASTIAVFDDGDVWPAAARAWQAVTPGECLITRGFAPAVATAAALARGGRHVVAFVDPVALDAAADQLATLVALDLPVVIVTLGDVPPSTLAAGLRARAAAASGGLEAALGSALAARAPALVVADAH